MNKKFLSAILFGALMVTSTGTFVSCKDYDDDIDGINKELTEIKSQIAALQGKIEAGKWITSVTPATGGFTVTFSDGSNYTITNGKDGQDGAAGAAGAAGTQWTISADGYWECDGVKTEVKAVGQDGAQGEAGKDAQPEVKFENGKWFLWNGTEFVEFKGAEATAANIPYCYEDPADPNYTILVAYTQDGVENKIRLPRTSGLGQIVVLDNSKALSIRYQIYNGVHKSGENATWAWESEDGSAKAKALPEKGEYMLTASSDAYYVQVVPAGYDISQLSFKLVNSKGDEAPIKLGAPVPCTVAVPSRANTSESGVYAIPFELKEMTDEVLAEYNKNISGKALSLVATESVRSTYTSTLNVAKAANTFGTFGDAMDIATENLGQPFTVTPRDGAECVYDSYLTMADAASKADSVRYGVKINGMTVTYNENIKKGTTMTFVVNELNAKAMINHKPSEVKVTFGKETPKAKEVTLTKVEHNAVAIYTNANGDEVNNQKIQVSFAEFFKEVTPTEGDRLIWNQDMQLKTTIDAVWTPVDNDGNVLEERSVALVNSPKMLGADGKSAGMDKFTTLEIPFKENYPNIKLGNGNIMLKVTFANKNDNEDTTIAYIPVAVKEPTAAEIATWYSWNANKNFANGTLTLSIADNTMNRTLNLADEFVAAQNASGDVASLYLYPNKVKNSSNAVIGYAANMSIGYPAGITKGIDSSDDAGKAKVAQAQSYVSWEGYTTVGKSNYWNVNDVDKITGSYMTKASLVVKPVNNSANPAVANAAAYFNNAYTIDGIKVKALGKGIVFDEDAKASSEDRVFGVNSIKLVIINKADDPRTADKISFSKSLEILSVQGQTKQYIRISNSVFAPNAASGSFFGSFTLSDFTGKNYVLESNSTVAATITDPENNNADLSSQFKVEVEEYTTGTGTAATTVHGLKITYTGTTEYPAGKALKMKLDFTNLKLDETADLSVTVKDINLKLTGL